MHSPDRPACPPSLHEPRSSVQVWLQYVANCLLVSSLQGQLGHVSSCVFNSVQQSLCSFWAPSIHFHLCLNITAIHSSQLHDTCNHSFLTLGTIWKNESKYPKCPQCSTTLLVTSSYGLHATKGGGGVVRNNIQNHLKNILKIHPANSPISTRV